MPRPIRPLAPNEQGAWQQQPPARLVAQDSIASTSSNSAEDWSGPSSIVVGELPVPRRQARQQAIRVACFACRKRRSKCDGVRPVCGFCASKGLENSCGYETEESGSRVEQMRRKIRNLEAQVSSLRAALAANATSEAGSLEQEMFESVGETSSSRRTSSLSVTNEDSIVSGWQTSSEPVSRSAASADGVLRIQEMVTPPVSAVALSPRLVLGHRNPAEESARQDKVQVVLSPYKKRHLIDPTPGDGDGEDVAKANYPRISSPPISKKMRLQRTGTDIILHQNLRSSLTKTSDASETDAQPLNRYINRFGNLPLSSSIRANHYSPTDQASQIRNCSLPLHLAMPLNHAAEITAESVYESFIQHCKERLAAGEQREHVLGPDEIDVGPLLAVYVQQWRRQRQAGERLPALLPRGLEELEANLGLDEATLSRAHPLIRWATDMIGAYAGFNLGLDIALATLYLKFHWVRWRSDPTPESYRHLPACQRPTQAQLMVPHKIVSDHVPWARLRDLWILAPEVLEAQGESWIVDFSETVSFRLGSWQQAVFRDDGGTWRLTEAFKRLCGDERSYTVTRALVRKYPRLADVVAVRDGEEEVGRGEGHVGG